MNKFKKTFINVYINTSSVLIDMTIVDILYLILGEIIIFAFLPNKKLYAIGFLVGVVISIISTIHMKITLEHALHHLEKSAVKRSIVAYVIRMSFIALIFCGMYVTGVGNLLAGLIGMFALKLSAYLQSFTHEIIKKIIEKNHKNSI